MMPNDRNDERSVATGDTQRYVAGIQIKPQ